jgi:CDP-4-dehydro-6-deoxyglucose reductase
MPEITIIPTGQRFVADAQEPVLTAALRAGLNLPHSCKGGHCASCRARVIEGSFQYPDVGLPAGITAEEARQHYVLLCQARPMSDMIVETREVRPAADVEVKSLPCRIDRLDRLTDDVMAVFLRLPAVEEFRFVPGQYLDVMLPQGRRRSFSIANSPSDGRLLELHVRKASASGFTALLFDRMRAGTLLRIEGPLGQFWFRSDSPRPALFVGGGTGYAPLRAMLRHLLAQGDQRPVTLYWGGRTTADLYEHDWLVDIAAKHEHFDYRPVISEPQESAATAARWNGRTGYVHEAVLRDIAHLAAYDVYASGPPAMVEAIRAQFAARGLPRDQLYFDSFDYAPDTLALMRGNR